MALHWDKIDHWRINKYLDLIRKQLIIIFQHINKTWDTTPSILPIYMSILYEECLKEVEVPLGVGMQLADIYIDEIKNNFEKSALTHERVVHLLDPFLQALGRTRQFALFERIKEKVFVKLIESNGIDADEENELYFPNFDIVEYAEKEIFELTSAPEVPEGKEDVKDVKGFHPICAANRPGLYQIYEKAAGREKQKEEPLSFAERLRQMRLPAIFKPKTKHQKKKALREKAKKMTKMKKRIMKLIRNQHLQLLQGGPQAEDSKIDTTSDLLALLNQKVAKRHAVLAQEEPVEKPNGVISNGVHADKEDTVIEIAAKPLKKKKNKKRKAELPSSRSSASKKVVFELEKNKTKEFFMFGKVGLEDRPKSKEIKNSSPGIIKKSILKRQKTS